jgi:hypothetical protein
MHEGVLQQLGTPTEVYGRPANLFVAAFIGSPAMNLLHGRVAEGVFRHTALGLPCAGVAEGTEAVLGLRPEDVTLGTGPFAARVRLVEPTGHEQIAVLDIEGGETLTIRADARRRCAPATAWPGRARRPPAPVRCRQRPAAGCDAGRRLTLRRNEHMDRNSVDWTGPMPAVTTPFDAAGRVDGVGFRANIARLLDLGATGIVACGCTGEFWSLSLEERRALYAEAVAGARGRGTVIVGTGCVGAADTIALAHAAREAGADGILGAAALFREADRRRGLRAFRGRLGRIAAADRRLQHPRQRGERDLPRAGRPPGRPRQGGGDQGEQRRLEQFLRHAAGGEGPHPRLLRALLGLRRAGHRGGRGRDGGLLPQCLARHARPLVRGARPRPGWRRRSGCRRPRAA